MDSSPPPPPFDQGTYVGGLAQMTCPRTPSSAPLIAKQSTPENLPDCVPIKIPSTSTSTFSAVRPYRVPIAYAPASPQQPSIHDHRWIQRQPHHPSHLPLSPPPYPSKRIVDRLHIPAVLEMEKERYQHLLFESFMKDGGGLIDIDGEKMLVEARDREKVLELKRREARAKLEGWEWDQREEEKRAGMGHVRRPVGMGGGTEDAVAVRSASMDRTAKHSPSQQLPNAGMEESILSRETTVPLSRSAALPKAGDTSIRVADSTERTRPHLRGGDASQLAQPREDLLDRNTAGTEAAGCALATRAEIKSIITGRMARLRTGHRFKSSAWHDNMATASRSRAPSRHLSRSQAKEPLKDIPALPSGVSDEVSNIRASLSAATSVSTMPSREHQLRLGKPLPPLPGQHIASSEWAMSCAAVFETACETSLELQTVTPTIRLRKRKGRSNLLVDGLVDGYLATWYMAD
ncbi:hypothetical protein B0A48_12317 [Cryoendolithus antarcticus]|uniref:Uncharacterized protein n=1 Tax=Cryoendolithus antarcticus TaxID=1507870 RepID=A0A1V8SS54_9PEZI|nr:hypothetical protein B0A48_12317 [Cryoendolithus antarcticus]